MLFQMFLAMGRCAVRGTKQGVRHRLVGCYGSSGEKAGNLAEGLQCSEVLRPDEGSIREFFLYGGEDFDPLDGVDPEVRIEPHVEVEHLDRITGFLADNGKEGSSGVNSVACRGSSCRGNDRTSCA